MVMMRFLQVPTLNSSSSREQKFRRTPTCCFGKLASNPNSRPLYPEVSHDFLKVAQDTRPLYQKMKLAHNYRLLALQVLLLESKVGPQHLDLRGVQDPRGHSGKSCAGERRLELTPWAESPERPNSKFLNKILLQCP